MHKKSFRYLTEALMFIIGAFLVYDGLVVQAITMDYAKYNIVAFDPIVSHTIIGFVLIGAVILDLKYSR